MDTYQRDNQGMEVNRAYVEQTMQMYKGGGNRINSFSYDIDNLKALGTKAMGTVTFKLDSTTIDSQGMMGAKGKTHLTTYAQAFNTTWPKTAND